jgi:hypothetical protein
MISSWPVSHVWNPALVAVVINPDADTVIP